MSGELSYECMDYIDSMFDAIDINNDGTICIKELTKCMDKIKKAAEIIILILDMAGQDRKSSDQEIQKMFEEADKDGDN